MFVQAMQVGKLWAQIAMSEFWHVSVLQLILWSLMLSPPSLIYQFMAFLMQNAQIQGADFMLTDSDMKDRNHYDNMGVLFITGHMSWF
jgi:hypothetical protein